VAGDKAPQDKSWRVVFPVLLSLLKDSGKAVASSARAAADALHLRCFRLGDAHTLGFVTAELHNLSGGGGSGNGGGGSSSGSSGSSGGSGGAKGGRDNKSAGVRAGSAGAMIKWLLGALQVKKLAKEGVGNLAGILIAFLPVLCRSLRSMLFLSDSFCLRKLLKRNTFTNALSFSFTYSTSDLSSFYSYHAQ
jgi:hypothetical protein